MRIISVLASLPVMIIMSFPSTVIAQEQNTNIKIKNNENFENKTVAQIPFNYEGYVPIKNPPVAISSRDKVLERWKVKQADKWVSLPTGKFVVNASAYTAAADECGKSDGITASGVKVKENRTIACPPEYPFGIKIKIEGYGTYVCEDRGGAIKGNKIDIYVETKAEAFAFGRRNLTAQVVK